MDTNQIALVFMLVIFWRMVAVAVHLQNKTEGKPNDTIAVAIGSGIVATGIFGLVYLASTGLEKFLS